jgi:hypothetical protein
MIPWDEPDDPRHAERPLSDERYARETGEAISESAYGDRSMGHRTIGQAVMVLPPRR